MLFGNGFAATIKETQLFIVTNSLTGSGGMVCVAEQDPVDTPSFNGQMYAVTETDRNALIAGVASVDAGQPGAAEKVKLGLAETMKQPSLGDCLLIRP